MTRVQIIIAPVRLSVPRLNATHHLCGVLDQELDLASGVQFLDGTASQRTTDLHTIRDNGWSDDLNLIINSLVPIAGSKLCKNTHH